MYEKRYNLLKSKFNELFLPTLLTTMANNICLLTDTLVVSFLIGSFNLAAIQLVDPVVTFVNLIYWMIGLGGSVLMATSKAEYDENKSNGYFTVSIISLIIIGILFTVLGLVFIDPIAGFLCSSSFSAPSPQLLESVKQYFGVTLIGIPFLCYMMSVSYFTRADGLPNLPLRAIIITNIVNLVLDFVYIKYLGWGIAGAAFATVSGDIIAAIYITKYFFDEKRTLKILNRSKLKIKEMFYYFKNILVSGFPPASIQLFFTLKILLLNILVKMTIKDAGLVALNVCTSTSFLIYMFVIGISQTMSPIVSVYYQEDDFNSVRYTIKRSVKISLALGTALSLIFIICPQVLLSLFSIHDSSQIPVVFEAIRLFSISFIGISVTFLMTYYAESIQRNSFSFLISIIEGFIVPVAAAYILVPIMGSNGIWVAFILAEIAAIIFIYAYSKYIEKTSNNEYHGFFILKDQDEENVIDLSIGANVEEITDLSQKVHDYLKSKDIDDLVSMRVSLALEEILVNIANINDEIDIMDVLIRIQKEHVLISIKDDGVEFNPTVRREGCEYDNIDMLNDISDRIDYARVLDLNSTVITINR